MPGPSRSQLRAEAKAHAATDYTGHNLHFAAASGNLGLVEFALSQGQPVNSVLNGVLPIHAACAGGSEIVVTYLLDEGADVNASRIPRRYSNEKSSGLTLGASGSTPLHFAAANGHIGIIRILLERGAIPNRSDEHGTTPEMLARENGWLECAELLRSSSELRQNDPTISGPSGSRDTYHPHDYKCDIADAASHIFHSGARKIHMKRSIDNAFHILRHHHLHHHYSQQHLRPPPLPTIASSFSAGASPSPSSPIRNQGDEINSSSPVSPSEEALAVRRPSLPHIFNDPPSPSRRRSSSKLRRRPRSAGIDSGQNENSPTIQAAVADAERPPPQRRLGNKYSLLHIFRRTNSESPSDNSYSSAEQNALHQDVNVPLATSPTQYSPSPLKPSPSSGHPTVLDGVRDTARSEGAHGHSHSPHKTGLRHRSSTDRLREVAQALNGSALDTDEGPTSQSPRPSILRGHGRPSSSHSSSPTPSALRILRFDSSSNGSAATTQLKQSNLHENGTSGQASPRRSGFKVRVCRSVSSIRNGGIQRTESLQTPVFSSSDTAATEYEVHRPRRVNSTNSRAQSGSIPPYSPNHPSNGSPASTTTRASPTEFSYTVTRGSTTPVEAHSRIHAQKTLDALKRLEIDSRERSTSISSADTDVSAGLESSTSSGASVTTNATTPYITSSSILGDGLLGTPTSPPTQRTVPANSTMRESPSSSPERLNSGIHVSTTEVLRSLTGKPSLDLRSISNHAEVEDLVKRTQKEIIGSAGLSEDDPKSPGIPLSEQLAAYGEILALERRFAKGEKQRRTWDNKEDSDDESFDITKADQARQSRLLHPHLHTHSHQPETQPRASSVTRQGTGSVRQKLLDTSALFSPQRTLKL